MRFKIINPMKIMRKFIVLLLILVTSITARAEFVSVPEGSKFKPSIRPQTDWAEVIELRELLIKGDRHYDVTYRYGNDIGKVLTKYHPGSRILVIVSVVPVVDR